MKRFRFLLPIFLSLVAAAGFAQSNGVIDEVLGQEKADFSMSVYLVLSAAEIIPESATTDEALSALSEKGWGLAPPGDGATITLGQYSHLLMQAFGIPGGVMYRLFPGPRYATREAAFRGFVSDRPTPYRSVSGEEAIRILGAVLSWKEERL
jgi:hypothetical protein